MQRRAAAIYFAFFVIVGAAAFGLIQTTAAPTVSMEGESFSQGDSVPYGDRDYTLSSVGSGTGELSWLNESAQQTAELENGSEVPVTDVSWEDQQARMEATFEAGSTVTLNGTDYEVSTNASASQFTLTSAANASVNETHAVGDEFAYRGYAGTVAEVTADAATVVYGGPYVPDVHNESVSNPTNATLIESPDYASIAAADDALYDDIVTINGTEMISYRANDTNVPIEEYFGAPETRLIEENGTLAYQGNETTVAAVTNETVELSWTAPQTETVSLTEGENVTLGDTQYFAFFPDDSSVTILETDEHYAEYRGQQNEVSSYHSRVLGLWGIAQLSAIAAIILTATAFLPVRG